MTEPFFAEQFKKLNAPQKSKGKKKGPCQLTKVNLSEMELKLKAAVISCYPHTRNMAIAKPQRTETNS